ncbi:hypothetical protein C8R44DRAFT_794253 [Mycena epipterygia]|nr:hypothetical protein C8R44DRAFT_794253 [Mycena epipterygia]
MLRHPTFLLRHLLPPLFHPPSLPVLSHHGLAFSYGLIYLYSLPRLSFRPLSSLCRRMTTGPFPLPLYCSLHLLCTHTNYHLRNRRKLVFYFVAEKRIDFCELVRELFRFSLRFPSLILLAAVPASLFLSSQRSSSTGHHHLSLSVLPHLQLALPRNYPLPPRPPLSLPPYLLPPVFFSPSHPHRPWHSLYKTRIWMASLQGAGVFDQ